MRWVPRVVSCAGLVAAGYVLGSVQVGSPGPLYAEPKPDAATISLRDRVRDADRALAEAMQALRDERKYVPAIEGLNAFAVSVGGIDAVGDLEAGQGVDPETFAGLYAGQALGEIADRLSRDTEGRLTYRGKIVRMYNATRLKELFAARAELVPPSGSGARHVGTATKSANAASEKKEE